MNQTPDSERKTLILTGLRKGELASLTVGQMHLSGPACYAELEAAIR